ncbi:hypothetical protein S245_013256 [Arachis hypogaea]
MFTPCANSKLKHKRDKKQTETQCWEEEKQENHGNKILKDPSLKGVLLKKVIFSLTIPSFVLWIFTFVFDI